MFDIFKLFQKQKCQCLNQSCTKPIDPIEPSYEEIRDVAHQLWIEEGCPEGKDLEHWEQARDIIITEKISKKI